MSGSYLTVYLPQFEIYLSVLNLVSRDSLFDLRIEPLINIYLRVEYDRETCPILLVDIISLSILPLMFNIHFVLLILVVSQYSPGKFKPINYRCCDGNNQLNQSIVLPSVFGEHPLNVLIIPKSVNLFPSTISSKPTASAISSTFTVRKICKWPYKEFQKSLDEPNTENCVDILPPSKRLKLEHPLHTFHIKIKMLIHWCFKPVLLKHFWTRSNNLNPIFNQKGQQVASQGILIVEVMMT